MQMTILFPETVCKMDNEVATLQFKYEVRRHFVKLKIQNNDRAVKSIRAYIADQSSSLDCQLYQKAECGLINTSSIALFFSRPSR